jgi:hypothetical protein
MITTSKLLVRASDNIVSAKLYVRRYSQQLKLLNDHAKIPGTRVHIIIQSL